MTIIVLVDYRDYVIKKYVRIIAYNVLDMAEHVFGVYVVKKPNTKSKVWQNFGIMATEMGTLLKERKISQSVGHAEAAFKQKEATPQTYFNNCANTTL